MAESVSFRLNGKRVRVKIDGERPLLAVIRTDFGLTGTKYGCGEGFCGACTVLVNDEPVRSCHMAVKDVEGKRVLTIEGLAKNGKLHPIQQKFIQHNAFQCGFCTSGMILTAYSLLLKKPQPNLDEIVQSLESNLCRCGAHPRIIQAVQDTSRPAKEA